MAHMMAGDVGTERIWFVLAIAALGAVSSGQGSGAIDLELEGFVLAPDGNPAEGTVVVSSAGGRAVTDAAGSYRLEVQVPHEATSVQLRAEGAAGRNLVATSNVSIGRGTRVAHVDPLQLGRADPCSPTWLPSFGGEPGTNAWIGALAVYDDGRGPALYAGGNFTTAGGAPADYIARWDGSSWSALGSGVGYPCFSCSQVAALTVYDDGSGPALYVGGLFTTAGGVPANHIARWDGSRWSALGSGMDWGVAALAVYDDGSGPALYAGGGFTRAGGVSASSIAKWDGSSWSALGVGVENSVYALAVFDDGGGPALFAGGTFRFAGGQRADRIAKWDGSSWSALGSGVFGWVATLAVHDDGSGAALYVGGNFTTAGGVTVNHIARWSDSRWSALGSGVFGPDNRYRGVSALAIHDDGSGPALYAGGVFTTVDGVPTGNIAKWDGSSWLAFSRGMAAPGFVYALAEYDDGGGPALCAGGDFTVAGDVPVSNIAQWDGSTWSLIGGSGLNGLVSAFGAHDDGGGPALYAGGEFLTPGGTPGSRIAKWDTTGWSALGSGFGYHGVWVLGAHDDGNGPAMHAGGEFTGRIASWDGSSWLPLASGLDGTVFALTVHDDGGGPELYAGGSFTVLDEVPLNRVAKWDGSSWSPLGSGVNHTVGALVVYDDGSGPALYAGGGFRTAGGVPANHIARWDGSSWSALGTGLSQDGETPAVSALTVYDDGGGPALYVGGGFTTAGNLSASHIAKWDGSSWSPLGVGMNDVVRALVVYDDGGGPALYAGGDFTVAGGVAANRIAKWDGSRWSPLGSGMSDRVWELAVLDDGSGPALFAAGTFSSAIDSGDSYVAKWAPRGHDLDFSAEDDFSTALLNGQDISNPPEFGRLVSISGSGPNAGAAVFDSTPGGPNDPGPDRDLLVGSGNILILQSDGDDEDTAQTVPGFFDRPNDAEEGGTMGFRFPAPMTPMSLDLIDIDKGKDELCTVILTDDAGMTRTFMVPPRWTGDLVKDGTSGKQTLDLTTLDPQPGFLSSATATEMPGFGADAVVRIEVELGSGGAVDDLTWCCGRPALAGHGSQSKHGANAPIGSGIVRQR